MSTLIHSTNSKGRLVSRCDSKCHNAEHPKCVCICGGINHGVGTKQAITNTRDNLELKFKDQEGVSFPKFTNQLTLL